MEIKHHLTEELLMAYAAGSLPEAFDLIIASHVSLCDECRAAVESYESVGGQLIDAVDVEPVSNDCLKGALDLIRTDLRAVAMPENNSMKRDDILPAPLTDYVGQGLEDVKWRSIGMGVKQAILDTTGDATARLLFIPAGVAVPDHGHNGMELTLVLKGAFQDEDGRFARGDIEVATEEVDHTPVADISEDCICLAVTDAPLRFKGLLPRLAQPFLKI